MSFSGGQVSISKIIEVEAKKDHQRFSSPCPHEHSFKGVGVSFGDSSCRTV